MLAESTAVICGLGPYGYIVAMQAAVRAVGTLPDSLPVITVIRFVVAFLVLLVPTSLMGATLPLVIKSAVAREERIGGRIGLLYAINTTGAIVGALFAGF
mgnify:CR=1 FL=1